MSAIIVAPTDRVANIVAMDLGEHVREYTVEPEELPGPLRRDDPAAPSTLPVAPEVVPDEEPV